MHIDLLSPDNIGQNSCPYCRDILFPAQLRYDDGDDGYDANEAVRPVLVLGNSMHGMARRIGRIERPLPGDRGVHVEVDADRNSQGMYTHFFQRTAEQYQESLQRARAISARIWSELNIPVDTNDPQLAEAIERDIAALATSFRTLAFREMVLYITDIKIVKGPNHRRVLPCCTCVTVEPQ